MNNTIIVISTVPSPEVVVVAVRLWVLKGITTTTDTATVEISMSTWLDAAVDGMHAANICTK